MKVGQLANLAANVVDRDKTTDHAAALRIAKALNDDQLIRYIQQNPGVLDLAYGNVPLRKLIVSCITKQVEEEMNGRQVSQEV